jgi:hypothetical protein
MMTHALSRAYSQAVRWGSGPNLKKKEDGCIKVVLNP